MNINHLVSREKASHWYLRDGTPLYQVPRADGNGFRDATLRDARKVGALPSVTTILSVVAKPGLESWKIEQGILSALTLPRKAGEPLDEFAGRIVTDMEARVDKAADFGTAMHAACEEYNQTRTLPAEPELLPYMKFYVEWFNANVLQVLSSEKVFVGDGYAGKLDLQSVLRHREDWGAVVDLKTQKVARTAKGEAKPAFYETWAMQLAAYGRASGMKDPLLVSLVMDSQAPGPVHMKIWNEDGQDHFAAFKAAQDLWCYCKGYDPRTKDS